MGAVEQELAVEQTHLSRLYVKLDELLVQTRAALDRTARSSTVGSPTR